MSAYKKIKCSLVDKPTLLSALAEMGLKTEVHETPQTLMGIGNKARPEKAEIIVRLANLNKSFTGASNDLGFLWNATEKQYDMIVSEYDVSSGVKNKIVQAYGSIAIQNALKNSRFSNVSVTGNVSQRAKLKVQISASKMI